MAYPITRLRQVICPITGLTVLISLVVNCSEIVNASPTHREINKLVPLDNSRLYPESAYTLGAGDRIRIEVLKLPQYSGEYEVLIDGTVNLLQGASLSVKGLTLEQAALAIADKYTTDRIIRQPQVNVSLLTPRPLKIGIAGEISRPGSYTISIEQSQFPSITTALELAGGITQGADLRRVQINRPQLLGSMETITVNLWDLIETGNLDNDLTLRDGDRIFIPTVDKINLAESFQLVEVSFAPDQAKALNITVIGEVFRPGPYTVTGSARTGQAGVPGGGSGGGNIFPTVTRAIQIAGGIKPLADIRQVQIRRFTSVGKRRTFNIDLWQLVQGGDSSQDVRLQQGDTVIVPTAEKLNPDESQALAAASFAPDSIRVNVVGEVIRPGVVQIPPNTPLNQAIQAAGGFGTRRANKGTVQLIRLNLDGTVSKRNVSINFAKGIDENSNPILQNNDVVIVNRNVLTAVTDGLSTLVSPVGSALGLFNFVNIFSR